MFLAKANIVKKAQAFIFFLPFILVCSTTIQAEEARDAERDQIKRQQIAEDLSQLKQEITREEGRYAALREREREIERELGELDKRAKKQREEKEALEKELEEISRGIDRVKLAIASSSLKAEDHRSDLTERIVAIYKTRKRLSTLDYLFKATSATDLLKRAYYLSRVAQYDREQIGILAERLLVLQKNQEELRGFQQSQALALSRSAEVNRELEKKKIASASLLREQREKTSLKKKSLVQLKSSATKLENALARLMGGDEPPADPPSAVSVVSGKTSRSEVLAKKTSAVSDAKRAIVTPPKQFQGRGLERLKGKLDFPVRGVILQEFGKRGHEEFSDVLFSKGLEVSAETGSEVRAVAEGRVIFSNTLPGYGHVIILDHGRRFYTLYGRVAMSLARVGDIIEARQTVARVGEKGPTKRNFYFELRIRGKAQNPAKFFAVLPR